MWFTASLLLKAVHINHPVPDPIWEERIVLLEAPNEPAARALAEKLGKEAEHEYYTSRAEDDRLRWTFVNVGKLYPVEQDLQSGTELFSRFLKDSEIKSMREPIE